MRFDTAHLEACKRRIEAKFSQGSSLQWTTHDFNRLSEAIHQESQRKDGAFIRVNMGGIPGNLFESEMFGHKRGAFTDARYDRKGRFETAHKGTIFLDEIGDMSLSAQAKVLRALQENKISRVGTD